MCLRSSLQQILSSARFYIMCGQSVFTHTANICTVLYIRIFIADGGTSLLLQKFYCIPCSLFSCSQGILSRVHSLRLRYLYMYCTVQHGVCRWFAMLNRVFRLENREQCRRCDQSCVLRKCKYLAMLILVYLDCRFIGADNEQGTAGRLIFFSFLSPS